MADKQLMDKELINLAYSAQTDIYVAQTKIHRLSTSGIGFDLSKPLNIMYKELEAMRYLLMVYSKDKKLKELREILHESGLGISTPQSLKAYFNLNDKPLDK